MKIQPGAGYGFTSSAYGFTLNTEGPFLPDEFGKLYPFTVINLGLVGSDYKFKVVAGQVDSLVPQLGTSADNTRKLDAVTPPTETWNFDSTTKYSYIYLKVSADTSTDPDTFPVNDGTDVLYPRVISTIVEQQADDDSGYLLLASAYKDPTTNVITIWQYIRNSQWCDRIKVGTRDAVYFFAAV